MKQPKEKTQPEKPQSKPKISPKEADRLRDLAVKKVGKVVCK